jgi:hypothetical protein
MRGMPEQAPKADERIVARATGELKRQLVESLADHPHFRGNVSEWVNACAQAWIVQTRRAKSRRGKAPAFPVEFVTIAQAK